MIVGRSLVVRSLWVLSAALGFLLAPESADAVEPALLQPGEEYRVTNESSFKGWSDIPAPDGKETVRSEFGGKSRVVYRERILGPTKQGDPVRLFRIYDQIDYERKVGDHEEKATVSPSLKRVLLDPVSGGYVIYSPDGPLRVPDLAMLEEHVHLPKLIRFIPEQELKAGDTWEADSEAVAELTGVDQIESGTINCKVEGTIDIKGKPFLQISGVGTIVGANGPIRSRNSVRLGVYLDETTGRFSRMRAIGEQQTLGSKDEVIGKVDVDYQVLVEPMQGDEQLAASIIETLPTSATPELLTLKFGSPAHGIEFDQSRRWILQRMEGNRIMFAGPDASFVVTVEPIGKTPSSKGFFDEVQAFLQKQKVDVALSVPLHIVSTADPKIDHFQFKGKVKDRPSVLDYWVVTEGDRGATVAVNVAESAPAGMLDEVASIVKSMKFFPPKTAPDAAEDAKP